MKQNKRLIGLTGGIATGKSAASSIIREFGYPVIDADQIARDMSRNDPIYKERIAEEFGYDLISEDGSLDREKLSQIVYNDREKLSKLDSISHPLIREKMKEETELAFEENDICFQDIPLLFESGLDLSKYDEIWLIYLPEDIQLKRLMERENIGQDQAMLRMSAQINIEEKKKMADIIIDNRGSISDLKSKIREELGRFK